jgi:phage shock protein A
VFEAYPWRVSALEQKVENLDEKVENLTRSVAAMNRKIGQAELSIIARERSYPLVGVSDEAR